MGWLYPQYVIGQVYDKNDEQLESLVKESEGLIVRINGKANGEITYFMAWDGSKEGWDTSDKYDKIREKFLKRLKEIDADWYCIDDDHEHSSSISMNTYVNPEQVVWQTYPEETSLQNKESVKP